MSARFPSLCLSRKVDGDGWVKGNRTKDGLKLVFTVDEGFCVHYALFTYQTGSSPYKGVQSDKTAYYTHQHPFRFNKYSLPIVFLGSGAGCGKRRRPDGCSGGPSPPQLRLTIIIYSDESFTIPQSSPLRCNPKVLGVVRGMLCGKGLMCCTEGPRPLPTQQKHLAVR